MDSINEITAKTEVPLEPSPEVKAKIAAKEENKRKLAEVHIRVATYVANHESLLTQ